MSFSFGSIPLNSTKKYVESINQKILLESVDRGENSPHLLILSDIQLSKIQLLALKSLLNSQIRSFSYDIVVATNIDVSSEEIKKVGIYRFFKKTRSDFLQFVHPNRTIVITLGYALSAITLSSDLSVHCFHDWIFNKTYFYSSYTNTYIFPADSFEEIFKVDRGGMVLPKDGPYRKFLNYQFSQIQKLYSSLTTLPRIAEPSIIRAYSEQEAADILRAHQDCTKVAWDIETDSLNFMDGQVGCLTMSFDGKEGFFLPWQYVDKEQLSEFFRGKYQIGQNLKFDIKFLKKQGIRNIQADSDTLPLGQTLNEMRYNGLKSLAYYYTFHGGYDSDLDEYISSYSPKNYLDIPVKILSQYATMDAIMNYQIHETMQQQLTELDERYPPEVRGHWTIREYYERARMPSFRAFVDIEYRGLPVDIQRWDVNSDLVTDKIHSLHEKLFKQLDVNAYLGSSGLAMSSLYGESDSLAFFDEDEEDFAVESKKLSSPQKLGLVLERKGWKDYGRSKNGVYLTGDDQLVRWEKDGHEEAIHIRHLRSYRTLQKTFLGVKDTTMGWRTHVREHSEDGSHKIHPSYRVMGTESGRNACTEPNWQNLPSSSLDAYLMKQVVSTPPKDQGKSFLCTLDYASLQMRLATIDSEDDVLMKAYRDNPDVDLHTKTGFNVFCKGLEFELDKVTLSDGTVTKEFWADEEISIMRNGAIVKIKARDAQEGDTFS